MIVKELTIEEFDVFSSNHILTSFYQTSNYGILMSKYGFTPSYIGMYKDETLIGASLILTKTISLNVKYGYAPRGFLTDYFNEEIFKEFNDTLRKYFNKKGYAFIKVNPIITYSEVNYKGEKNINDLGKEVIERLERNNYKKLKDNIYFESVLPKYNPIVDLSNFNFQKLDRKLQTKINRVNNKGLSMIKGDIYNINTLYDLVYKKDNISPDFYKTFYKIFNEKNLIDLYLIEVDYHEYLKRLAEDHNTEETINEKINKIFQMDPTNKQVYNEKMNSDKKLNQINDEISSINNKVQNGIYKEIVAAGLVIKQGIVANIYTSGFKKEYNRLLPNHYLHYMLINHYKNEGLKFIDLNGITGDFSKENPYKGLNEFKMSWLPRIYEYIGEFDFIVNQTKYSLLWSTKALHREFEKKNLKTIN